MGIKFNFSGLFYHRHGDAFYRTGRCSESELVLCLDVFKEIITEMICTMLKQIVNGDLNLEFKLFNTCVRTED